MTRGCASQAIVDLRRENAIKLQVKSLCLKWPLQVPSLKNGLSDPFSTSLPENKLFRGDTNGLR